MDTILKKIEHALKKKINKFIDNNFAPTFVNSPTQLFNNVNRILLLRQDRIGDLLISVPFIKELYSLSKTEHTPKKKFQIDILLGKKNFGAKKSVEKYVNEIYIYDKNISSTLKLIQKLNSNNYDLIIDLFDNVSSTSNFFLKFIKSQYKLGLSKENNSQYTHIVPLKNKGSVHIIDRIANLLLPFGIQPEKIKFEMEYPVSQEEKLLAEQEMQFNRHKINIAFVLSGSSPAKFWGKENIISLIKKFKNSTENAEFYLFGTNKQTAIIYEIQKQTNCKIAPITRELHKFATYLSVCNLIITPDTSAVHFASAFKIPTVVFYRQDLKMNLLPWFPYNSPYKALITNEPSLSSISVEITYNTIKEMIKDFFYNK